MFLENFNISAITYFYFLQDLDGSDREESGSPIHFQNTLQGSERSSSNQIINLGNYFPRVASEPTNRKRYHTAPREKHRVSFSHTVIH